MDDHISIVTLYCFFFFFFFLINTFPQSHCQTQPPSYNDSVCIVQPYNCGNLSNIWYPFWGGENRPRNCGGGELFKLNCHNNKTTTISIQSQNFTVLNISTEDNTIKMKRTDLDINVCSPKFDDTYFTPNLIRYSSTVNNITIFYNCSSSSDDDFFPNSMCGDPNNTTTAATTTAIWYVGVVNEVLEDIPSLNSCKRHIQVPVEFSSLNYSHNKDRGDLELGLKEGFEVRYMVDEECVKCLGNDFEHCSWDLKNGPDFDKQLKSCRYINCQDGSIASEAHCSPHKNSTRSHSSLNPPEVADAGNGDPFSWKRKIVIGVGSAVALTLLICIIIYCFRRKISKRQVRLQLTTKNDKDIEAFLKNHGALSQNRYTFSEVKKMTNSFKVKLGEGGFGAVYKGELLNGFPVAVKMLKASKGNGEEFINEVASISRTSHVNVVSLLGFCFEGCKKALIYEFMAKGSLDNFIYNRGSETIASLRLDNLYQIAKGIARGLEYLHRGCNTRILHFDIKPHNILLDENFCPKISDFGLAKLCPKKESIISMSDARGTMGYVAPEVWNRQFGGVSHKSDVYSYGMMLLEMVGGRKNINAEASHTSEIYYPYWVYTRLQLGSDLRPDGVIVTEEDEIARRMTIVGLWCIQTFPNDRPTMSKVIEMLEGNMNALEIPQTNVFFSY